VLNYQTIKLKNTITEEEIEALIAKRQTQAKEEEEREEKFAEQDTAINMISREEDSHKDKIDTPSSGEHIDEIQSEQTKEEESTDSAQGSGVIGPDNAENI